LLFCVRYLCIAFVISVICFVRSLSMSLFLSFVRSSVLSFCQGGFLSFIMYALLAVGLSFGIYYVRSFSPSAFMWFVHLVLQLDMSSFVYLVRALFRSFVI